MISLHSDNQFSFQTINRCRAVFRCRLICFLFLVQHLAMGQEKHALSYQSDPLEDSLKKYDFKGAFSKSMSFADKWLEKTKTNPGKDSLDYAAALNAMGTAMGRKNGGYKEAEDFILHAYEIRRRALGPNHLDVAYSLNNLGVSYSYAGNPKKSVETLLQALEIRKRILGTENLEVATTLNNLGNSYSRFGDHDKSIDFLTQALEIRKKILGNDHRDVAASYNNLGNSYNLLQEVARAEEYFLMSLEIKKKIFGEEHMEVAKTLNNLGNLYAFSKYSYYLRVEDYIRAENYFLKSLEIKRKIYGEKHPEVATTLHNLGTLHMVNSDYTKSEALLLKSLEIRRATLGGNHPEVALSLVNLASIYERLGNYSKSESFIKEALEIRKKTLGENHSHTKYTSMMLIDLYSKTYNFPKATNLFQNLKGTYDKNELERNIDLNLKNAYLNLKMNNFKRSEEIYTDKIKDLFSIYGKDNTELVNSYFRISDVYYKTGKYPKSSDYLNKIIDIAKDHEKAWVIDAHFMLAKTHFAMGEMNDAQPHFRKFSLANQGNILRFLPSLSGKDQEHLLENEESKFQICQSYCVKAGSSIPELRGELYNQQLFFKGLLLNTSARWKQRVKTSGDLKLIRRYDEWTNLQHKISNLFTSTDSTERGGLDSLVQKAEKLEKELSQRSENFVRSEERKVRTWKEVQQSIKPGEAAIEMVRIKKFGVAKIVTDTSDPKKPNYNIKGLTDTIQYAALIVTKTCAHPELVLLENGNDLEGKWYMYYSNAIRSRNDDKKTYRHFWEPISRKLKGIKKVWFSADGVYHKINPGTLKNPVTGKFLSEEVELSLLGSTKDLLKVYPDESENRLACLIGNPDFQPGQLASSGKSRTGPEMSYYYKPNPNLEISTLPGTQTEVDSVSALMKRKGWEVQVFSGTEASEDKVKDCYKPRVMLLSTHGFFQPDTTPGNNPLIRSGLLLTGAAKTLREGRNAEDGEDGILTSYEAMNLNLDNTELVVLSACETGLGEIKNGEGVYGLQRAFQVAGARNLIMSLWKVNDDVTQQLMVRFFTNWLNGKSKQTAFAQAQKEILTKYPEPYYWGGFVLLGK